MSTVTEPVQTAATTADAADNAATNGEKRTRKTKPLHPAIEAAREKGEKLSAIPDDYDQQKFQRLRDGDFSPVSVLWEYKKKQHQDAIAKHNEAIQEIDGKLQRAEKLSNLNVSTEVLARIDAMAALEEKLAKMRKANAEDLTTAGVDAADLKTILES